MTPEGAWKTGEYQHATEPVSIDFLSKLHGNSVDRKRVEQIKGQIEKEGLNEPIIFSWGMNDHYGIVLDGNHRLTALREMGYTHAPIRMMRLSKVVNCIGSKPMNLSPKKGRYFLKHAKPSQVFIDKGHIIITKDV